MLNISPRADAVIPDEQRQVLASIGQWMGRHGNAVYGIRACSVFGYGDAEFEESRFGGQSATMEYSKNNIRFTQSKGENDLYVCFLGLPDANAKIEIKDIPSSEIKNISVLESGVDVEWSEYNDPEASAMDELATVFQIIFHIRGISNWIYSNT